MIFTEEEEEDLGADNNFDENDLLSETNNDQSFLIRNKNFDFTRLFRDHFDRKQINNNKKRFANDAEQYYTQ